MLFSLQEQPVREEMGVDRVSGQVAWGLPYVMSKGTVVTALDSAASAGRGIPWILSSWYRTSSLVPRVWKRNKGS